MFKQCYFSLFYLNLVKTSLNPQISGLARNSISVTWSYFVEFHTHQNTESSLARFGWHRLPLRRPMSRPLWCGGKHRCLGFSFPRPSDSPTLPTPCCLHGPWLPRLYGKLDVQNLSVSPVKRGPPLLFP